MRVIDSHTGGQPTRVIVDGGPDLGTGPLSERKARLASDHDQVRRRSILEPRCADAMVGALLCEPHETGCSAGIIFFNNAGYLGMCGHGMIGVAVTLAYLGQLEPGRHRIDTPAGVVAVELVGPNRASIENVPSYRLMKGVDVEVPGLGNIRGDIAWGGNWFFLGEDAPVAVEKDNIAELTAAATAVRRALEQQGITGAEGAEIDHIEFFGPAAGADSRNFVLCPGLAYDRSPCGTGTSAKIACLAEDGKLAPGNEWVQESVIGSRFVASYRRDGEGRIIPTITGDAYVTADAQLVFQDEDPFREGVR